MEDVHMYIHAWMYMENVHMYIHAWMYIHGRCVGDVYLVAFL